MFIYNNQFHYFESTLLKELGITSGFGTKKTPPIQEVICARSYISMLQVHSTIIHVINDQPAEDVFQIEHIDGMLTQLSQVALLIKTADCVPVLHYDPVKGIIAVSHQGWKGTINTMARQVIDLMKAEGSQVKNIRLALGPALGDCCNRLYDQRYTDFKNTFGPWFEKFTRKDGDDTYLNLSTLNALQYTAAGVLEEHIDINTHCTRCESDLFFSYDRRDYDASDPRTRNWSFIMK